MKLSAGLVVFGFASLSLANPYPDPNAVPKDRPYRQAFRPSRNLSPEALRARSIDVLRVEVSWTEGEKFHLERVVKEPSGTPALLARATKPDALGSYQGVLLDAVTQEPLAYDAVGTGKEYRLLTRAFSFRFPIPQKDVLFALIAENPKTGEHERVLVESLTPSLKPLAEVPTWEVKMLKPAAEAPPIRIVFYAEGYLAARRDVFFQKAQKAMDAILGAKFPGYASMEFIAAFAPSKEKLGDAKNLGLPIPEKDTVLGLYYPYWNDFGRWYHIVYPTREGKFRDAIGQVPYDYPIALVDSSAYWGVGNFNQLTAIPAENSSFTYLLLHEFGHFFGLNEEYEGGGPTELAFASGISEPWSQNITFLKSPENLKWKSHVASSTPVPTSSFLWEGTGPIGAYRGGYADTEPLNQSHKPGLSCVMKNGSKFCPVCQEAIQKKIDFDLGKRMSPPSS